MESKNALAELAEDLEEIVRDTKSDFYTTAISKTARIVSELAKVNTLGPKHIPGDISLYAAYAKCRVIAEEGAGDGK